MYDKLECYQNLATFVDQLKAKYDQALCAGNGVCVNVQHFLADYKQAVNQAVINDYKQLTSTGKEPNLFFTFLGTTSDFFAGNAAFNAAKLMMHVLQYFFMFAIKSVYFLSVLTFPVAAAWSIIPFASGAPIKKWLAVFYGTILAEFYYVIMIGLASVVMTKLPTTNFSDVITALIFGVGAPTASTYLAKSNASGAMSGMSASFAQYGQSIPIVSGLAAGLTRFRSR